MASTAATTAPAPLRLTKRGRRVVRAIVALPFAAALALGATHLTSAMATDADASVEFEYVTVAAGETLWQIAEREAGEQDVRDVISEITSLNGLESSTVQAGQRLALPLD